MNAAKGTVRFRAAKACKRCHQRRVKCDATDKGIPCSTCVQHKIEPCVLIESKRGTYQRQKQPKPSNHRSTQPAQLTEPGESSPGLPPSPALNQLPQQPTPLLLSPGPVWAPASPRFNPSAHATEEPINPPGAGTAQNEDSQGNPHDHQGQQARADLSSPDDSLYEPPSSSYREITWSAMFEHFLKTHRRSDAEVIDKCSINYLGESFPLSMVLDGLHHGGQVKVHHPGPLMPKSKAQSGLETNDHPDNIPPEDNFPPEDIIYLKAKGGFEYPAPETLVAFTDTFLNRVYPLYPIVHRQEFIHQVETRRLPWILLQSFCFAAATFCPLSVLHRAGFDSRKTARLVYHNRAKALFDTGYEANKIVNLQSVILLSLWAGGPNSHWNFFTWISQGVTLAEALGIHRSMTATNIISQDRSLLRRLWWALVVRDTSCGTLVGRPFRINLLRSDVEPLTLDDFVADMGSPEFATHPLQATYGLYHVHMCRLTLILRDIVSRRFDPGQRRETPTCDDFTRALKEWRYQLPSELNWNEGLGEFKLFPSCLSLMYHHHLILTNLSQTKVNWHPRGLSSGATAASVDCSAQKILATASLISRKSAQLLMPHEAYPALFLAQVAFYIQMKSPQKAITMLGRSAIAHCQTIWCNIADAWDSASWVMQMFDNLLASSRDPDLSGGHAPSSTAPQPNLDQWDGQISFTDDLWGNYPVLSNLFDMSGDHVVPQVPTGTGLLWEP
ncbi:fungal-specific transcription factor domain-containing protein [Aspergillus heterothallicus]